MENYTRGQICEIFKIKNHKLFRIEFSGAIQLDLEKNHAIYYDFDQLVHLYFFNLLNEITSFSTAVEVLKSTHTLDLKNHPNKKFIVFSDRIIFLDELDERLDETIDQTIIAYFTWSELTNATIRLLERSYQTVQAS